MSFLDVGTKMLSEFIHAMGKTHLPSRGTLLLCKFWCKGSGMMAFGVKKETGKLPTNKAPLIFFEEELSHTSSILD